MEYRLVLGAVAFMATLSFSRTRAEDINELNRVVMEIKAERRSNRHPRQTSSFSSS
ncbi:hypothetical protein ACE6H2_023560 [Prunus campanulata]